MNAESLLIDLCEAHGGLTRWQSVDSIDFALTSSGLAFSSHGQGSALVGVKVRLWPHQRRVELHHYGGQGKLGVWTPDHIALQEADGKLLAERAHPRNQFKRLSKRLLWDKLDMLYFGGYALWNYLSFPFLLAEPGVRVSLPTTADRCAGLGLVAEFDGSVPTHSARQAFHLDDAHHLIQHDYTADVIGSWATAANRVLACSETSGFRFYTRRRVTPRMGPWQTVLPFPILVRIDITELDVTFKEVQPSN
ncbi:MAG TPA: hypothetical protein PK347_11370 [Burkholderiaceae bacterium]|nr:hypothetical protein [Burkholderiaceae bacterium]